MLRKALVLAALAAGLVSGEAFAQAKQDFTIVNRTGYTINEIYVGPVSSSEWGNDVMGDDAIDDGESARISFTGGSKACKWDIKVVYDDGDTAEFGSVNLCNINTVTLFWNRKAGTTRAETE